MPPTPHSRMPVLTYGMAAAPVMPSFSSIRLWTVAGRFGGGASLLDGDEALGLDHLAADDDQQEGRENADQEHRAPAERADQSVDPGSEDVPEGAPGHHDPRHLGARGPTEHLDEERDADDDL